MAERDDRMAQDARNAQSGQNSGQKAQGGSQQGQGASRSGGDDRQELDQALQRRNEDLAGDIETNRNLTGSTTYETLHEQGDLDVVEENTSEGGSTGDSRGGSRGGSSQGGSSQGGSSGGGMR